MKASDRLAGTLLGNMIVMVVVLGIPGFVAGIANHRAAGVLTWDAIVKLIVIIFPASAAGGALLWFFVTRSLARRRWPNGPPP